MNAFIFIALVVVSTQAARRSDDDDWVHLPNKCEVCKFLSIEMKSALEETGKTKEVIETNYRFLDDKGAPPIKYVKSDIRFIEVMENVCSRILQYNLHKERDGSNRFAKGMSETFSTLHNLVHKGVNVVMDIPYELWNETSAEVSDLKKQEHLYNYTFMQLSNLANRVAAAQCEKTYRYRGAAYARKVELYQVEEEEVGGLGGGTYSPYHMLMHMHLAHRPRNSECDVMVEQYEEVIEDWYKGNQEEDLMTYLCEKHVLKGQDTSCLKEIWHEKKGDPAAIAQDKKKKKSKKKAKGGEHNQNREKKVKKKKSKLDEHSDKQKTEEEGHTSDEEIQRSVHQERTEL